MKFPPAQQILKRLFAEQGLEHYGWTKLTRPLTFLWYQQWLEKGHAADMDYLQRQAPLKENPRQFRDLKSALVLAIPYVPHPWPPTPLAANRIALYAQGADYHRRIPEQLAPFVEQLRAHFPEDQFEIFTDSAPILERDLAYRAGLGWVGKNTCLIHPKKGSLFFLAEIYTSMELENETAWSPDFCGSCRKCITACPTQALTENRELIPSRCISYWTIEAKTLPPENIRTAMGDWLFGCDLCQTACPWNKKTLTPTQSATANVDLTKTDDGSEATSSRAAQLAELQWILQTSRKALQRELAATPMARAAGWKLQRNAIIVATNKGFTELRELIATWRDDEKLGELAEWSLRTLRDKQ